MAHTTTNQTFSFPGVASVSRFFDALVTAFLRMSENNPKVRQLNALMALSDQQLADRGLKRDELAYFVFRDSFWT